MVILPPPAPRRQATAGCRGPIIDYPDEIRARKINALQEIARKELEAKVKIRRDRERRELGSRE